MAGSSSRLAVSLATLVAWTIINVFGTKVFYPPETALDDLVTTGISWPILFACLLLVAVVLWQHWTDLRFRAPDPGTLKLLLFPGFLLLLLLALAVLSGLPSSSVMVLLGINTLLVGFSEETMFRGILFRALRGRLGIWSAILVTTVAFGSVHILNGFGTGDFGAAFLQAITAGASGLLLIAILLRTGSLWAAIIFHALWDWATFLVVVGAKVHPSPDFAEAAVATPPGMLAQVLLPLGMVLPGFFYGLWLLRNIHKETAPGDRKPDINE
ncbi:CPBP family intramembrane glutamic endopeptidase [Roseibium algicola]|jgi:hypothetical protein|uniref:CPBP family intramembrane glutamic endopeptidase n=1 Tax=Roseibium algicola TaxID=2857014 RepID=UPI003458DDAB